jgi:hypothetical protein
MARITWTNHPTDKNKNGSVEHVKTTVADYAIAVGQAVAAPYKNYVDRLQSEEAQRQANIPQSQRELFYATATWQLSTSAIAQEPTIVKLLGREQTVYAKAAQRSDKDFRTSMRDAGCPDKVISAYLESVNSKVDPEILQERQIQERNRQNAATQLRQRDAGATAVILGGNLMKAGQ